jgi:hypothetical protein
MNENVNEISENVAGKKENHNIPETDVPPAVHTSPYTPAQTRPIRCQFRSLSQSSFARAPCWSARRALLIQCWKLKKSSCETSEEMYRVEEEDRSRTEKLTHFLWMDDFTSGSHSDSVVVTGCLVASRYVRSSSELVVSVKDIHALRNLATSCQGSHRFTSTVPCQRCGYECFSCKISIKFKCNVRVTVGEHRPTKSQINCPLQNVHGV